MHRKCFGVLQAVESALKMRSECAQVHRGRVSDDRPRESNDGVFSTSFLLVYAVHTVKYIHGA